jgi:CoA-transferase family III
LYIDACVGFQSSWLDLKQPEGRQRELELARRADVFVENFRGRSMSKLGFSPIMREITTITIWLERDFRSHDRHTRRGFKPQANLMAIDFNHCHNDLAVFANDNFLANFSAEH